MMIIMMIILVIMDLKRENIFSYKNYLNKLSVKNN